VRRRWIWIAGLVLVAAAAGALLVAGRAAGWGDLRSRAKPVPDEVSQAEQVRASLYGHLQPVTLANCELARFGEPHDGGYLMCANLLDGAQSGYSYGIAGYDQWGCDISTKLGIPVHQYDCFDLSRTECPGGDVRFNEECVGPQREISDGRLFDTVENQLARNGDAGLRVVMKMDVEGAEWDVLLQVPPEVLERIDQLAIEFHGVDESRFAPAVLRLKEFFHVAHLHFNNFTCTDDIAPFPAWAYEVLFVNKRIAVVDPAGGPVPRPHPLDAPNDPELPDCPW
jgi:hypothetical protein